MGDRTYTVYIHTSPSGKVYIGITCQSIDKRWQNGYGYVRQAFFNAIKKYGWNNIKHEILYINLTKEEAENIEIELIAKYKSNQREFGYNIDNGGKTIGTHSEETKRKISKASKGFKHSDEVKKRLSEINKGRVISEETRQKMRENNKGENNPNYGKHHSVEARRKISEANMGEKNHSSKKIYCNKLIFSCIRECAEFYDIPVSTMKAWLTGRNKMRDNFVEFGLRYATEEDILKYPIYKKY